MAEITVVLLTAAADRNHFDFGLVQFRAGAEAFLRLTEALRLCVVLFICQKHIGHSIVLVGVKKIGDRRMAPSGGRRRFCFGFGGLCQLEPFLFPPGFIAGFDLAQLRAISNTSPPPCCACATRRRVWPPKGWFGVKKSNMYVYLVFRQS